MVPLLGGVSHATTVPYFVYSPDPALRAGLQIRFDFGADGFSAELTTDDLLSLQALGVALEPVAVQTVDAKGGGGGKPAQDPVPWGVEREILGTASGNNTLPLDHNLAGTGVTVAILDTGIDVEHPDLKNRMGAGAAACYNFLTKTASCADDNGHGTSVAGPIAADRTNTAGIWGVAPGARLFAYKVCDAAGNCATDAIAAAIRAAADNGANIVNISLSGSIGIYAENLAIDYAAGKGTLVVASAGNSPNSNYCLKVKYPAAYPGAISVASIDKTDTVPASSCRGNNNGDAVRDEGELDVAAPGVAVPTTGLGGYTTMTGTSAAVPYISGVAAHEWVRLGGAQAVRAYLRSTADDIVKGVYAAAGEDKASGKGLPDIA